MNDVHLTRRQADVLSWLEEHLRAGRPPPDPRRDLPRAPAPLPGVAPQARARAHRRGARRADPGPAARRSAARPRGRR